MEDDSSSRKPGTEEPRDISKAPSTKAKLNKNILEHLQATLQNDPGVGLHSEFLRIFEGTVFEQKQRLVALAIPKRNVSTKPRGPPNFFADLVARALIAEIVYSLSDETRKLLIQYMQPNSESQDLNQSLVYVLSQIQ